MNEIFHCLLNLYHVASNDLSFYDSLAPWFCSIFPYITQHLIYRYLSPQPSYLHNKMLSFLSIFYFFFTATTSVIKNSAWFCNYSLINKWVRTNVYWVGFKQADKTDWHEQKVLWQEYIRQAQGTSVAGIPDLKRYWVSED